MPFQVNPLGALNNLPDSSYNTTGALVKLVGPLDPSGQAGKAIGVNGSGDAVYLSVGGSSNTAHIPFSYGDASPANLYLAAAGTTVSKVLLIILVPFDGAGAALTVGDSGQADRFMPANANDPFAIGSFETNPAFKYGSQTQITLSISPGAGATQGSGVAVVSFYP